MSQLKNDPLMPFDGMMAGDRPDDATLDTLAQMMGNKPPIVVVQSGHHADPKDAQQIRARVKVVADVAAGTKGVDIKAAASAETHLSWSWVGRFLSIVPEFAERVKQAIRRE